jgi:cytoskeletal protein RodZ
MKNNSLLTYVLYALLALILTIAGYYACQKQQKDKKMKAEQDEAELQQTLRDMGYAPGDSAAATGSSFAGGDSLKTSSSANKPTVNKDGIETEPSTAATPVNKNAKPAVTTAVKPQVSPSTTASTNTVKPVTKTTAASKGVAGPGSGRWAVRAGTFSYMEGARRRLEEVIQAGYRTAEISKTSDGKAAVVVFRSNDKNAAIRVVDKLEEKGIDAAVFDRNN